MLDDGDLYVSRQGAFRMVDTGTEITQQLPTITGQFTGLRKAMADAIATVIPEGKTGAMVAVASAEGFRFTLAQKIGDTWQIAGDVSTDIKGQHVTGRILVAGTW